MGGHDGSTAGERPSCSGEKREKPSSHGDSVADPRAVQPLTGQEGRGR